MMQKYWIAICIFNMLFLAFGAETRAVETAPESGPILLIVADKLDSQDVFQNPLPGIRRLLEQSSSGLMSIRSGSGYTKSPSGYLTLGSGNRSTSPNDVSGALESGEAFGGLTAQDFWKWSADQEADSGEHPFLVPEFGWIANRALDYNKEAAPGLLGELFRKHGWKTLLFGNSDYQQINNRPGGLMLMDRNGVIDGGLIAPSINTYDQNFPYLLRFDPMKTLRRVKNAVQPRTLIMVDFGDFARLDLYRETMLDAQYRRLKTGALRRLDRFISEIVRRWTPEELTVVVVSPTISMESYNGRRMLAPIMIRNREFSWGVLRSGTTNWPGVVSNIDLLPTLLQIAGFAVPRSLDGRPFEKEERGNSRDYMNRLYNRINADLTSQRPILNWYLGMITFGWIVGFLGLFTRWSRISEWIFTGVAAIPLVLIVFPLFPIWSWQIPGVIILTLLITVGLSGIKDYQSRFLLLSVFIWLSLAVDQIAGWNLIRFSAMGYNPAAGARYYGIGNEFMGTFLPVSLILAEMIYLKTRRRWPALMVLVLGIAVLGWPKWGINFGGTLAAITGFTFYLFRLSSWKLKDKRLWMIVILGMVTIGVIGLWDAFRPPEYQTHIGRFFRLIFSNRSGKILFIFQRKLGMNLKLMMLSPWARIVWLALGLGLVNRLIAKTGMVAKENALLWQGIIVTGIAAFALNDSGIVALATGMAYGFSYILVGYGIGRRLKAEGGSDLG
jgi:hypothetical protein